MKIKESIPGKIYEGEVGGGEYGGASSTLLTLQSAFEGLLNPPSYMFSPPNFLLKNIPPRSTIKAVKWKKNVSYLSLMYPYNGAEKKKISEPWTSLSRILFDFELRALKYLFWNFFTIHIVQVVFDKKRK